MTDWTPAAVRAAAAEWVWVPADAKQVLTGEYQLIAYPAHYQHPTQVAWSSTARPAGELIEEVLSHVSAWGRDSVYWWVRDDTAPADTEAILQARGATLAETVQVLGYDLASGFPELSLADGPQAELVCDERTLRASHLVSAEVWDDRRERTPAAIAEELSGVVESLESLSDYRIVVFVDGQPAAGGGCSIVGEVARLWGGGSRPSYRRRGAYRELLAARIRIASQRGATLALVKGRAETSGPILRRAGFTSYAEERSYCVPVPG